VNLKSRNNLIHFFYQIKNQFNHDKSLKRSQHDTAAAFGTRPLINASTLNPHYPGDATQSPSPGLLEVFLPFVLFEGEISAGVFFDILVTQA
jgi:hypothetical protein